jgi:hypothetical protein
MENQTSTTTPIIKEIVTEATLSALNDALAEQKVPAQNIVAIHYVPRKALAIGDYEAEYRVLYR